MKKKALGVLFGVCISFCLIFGCITFSTPKLDIVYDYNGQSYVQNTHSLFRKKISLPNYTNISSVLPSTNGWFCCAKKGDNDCFLFVSKENEVTQLAYSGCRIIVKDVFMYNGMYSLIVDYFESENDIPLMKLLSIDFADKNLIIQNLPEEFTAYSIISNGSCLWGSNGDKIFKYENGKTTEVIEGSSVLGIIGNSLFYEDESDIYCLDLKSNKKVKCNYNMALYEYRTIDFVSKFCFTKNYIVGCKIGFLKYSGGSANVTHTAIFDLKKNKSYPVYGSIGKIYENIQIVTNRSEYKEFT